MEGQKYRGPGASQMLPAAKVRPSRAFAAAYLGRYLTGGTKYILRTAHAPRSSEASPRPRPQQHTLPSHLPLASNWSTRTKPTPSRTSDRRDRHDAQPDSVKAAAPRTQATQHTSRRGPPCPPCMHTTSPSRPWSACSPFPSSFQSLVAVFSANLKPVVATMDSLDARTVTDGLPAMSRPPNVLVIATPPHSAYALPLLAPRSPARASQVPRSSRREATDRVASITTNMCWHSAGLLHRCRRRYRLRPCLHHR